MQIVSFKTQVQTAQTASLLNTNRIFSKRNYISKNATVNGPSNRKRMFLSNFYRSLVLGRNEIGTEEVNDWIHPSFILKSKYFAQDSSQSGTRKKTSKAIFSKIIIRHHNWSNALLGGLPKTFIVSILMHHNAGQGPYVLETYKSFHSKNIDAKTYSLLFYGYFLANCAKISATFYSNFLSPWLVVSISNFFCLKASKKFCDFCAKLDR